VLPPGLRRRRVTTHDFVGPSQDHRSGVIHCLLARLPSWRPLADPRGRDRCRVGRLPCADGHRQAGQVARAIADVPALIVTSPYLRACQTAQPTISRFPAAECQQWPVHEFTYLGDLHGRASTAREREPYARAHGGFYHHRSPLPWSLRRQRRPGPICCHWIRASRPLGNQSASWKVVHLHLDDLGAPQAL
jgi:hypothetical protein